MMAAVRKGGMGMPLVRKIELGRAAAGAAFWKSVLVLMASRVVQLGQSTSAMVRMDFGLNTTGIAVYSAP